MAIAESTSRESERQRQMASKKMKVSKKKRKRRGATATADHTLLDDLSFPQAKLKVCFLNCPQKLPV